MSLAARLNRLGLSVYAPRFEEEGLLELADLEFCFREDFVDMGLTLDQATQLLDGFPGRYLLRPDLPHRASQLPVYRSGLHLPPEPEVKEEGDRSDAQASEDHECPKPQACKVEEVSRPPPEEVFRGHFSYCVISEEEWNVLVSISGDSLRLDLWNRLAASNPRNYGGRAVDVHAQVLRHADVPDERLIAAGVTDAVLRSELQVLDMILKGGLSPGEQTQEYQRYLLGQVLSVKAYPVGRLDFRIAVRVRRTCEDVDTSGAYLGDLFQLIQVNVQSSTEPLGAQDTLAIADWLNNDESRVRVEVVERDTDSTFDEMEEYLFPVPLLVLDSESACGSSSSITGCCYPSDREDEDPVDEEMLDASLIDLPSVSKIVGPNPERQPSGPDSENPSPARNVRMDVRYTRVSPETWRDICSLEERQFEREMDRLSQALHSDEAQGNSGTLSELIPQGLDWVANPTLSVRSEDGDEIPLCDVLHYQGDDLPPDVPVTERMLVFTIWDRIREGMEVVIIVARLVEGEAEPSAGAGSQSSGHDHLPPPPGPEPPAIRAVRLPPNLGESIGVTSSPPGNRRCLSVIPVSSSLPAYLRARQQPHAATGSQDLDGNNSEESSTSLSEEPRVCAVSESLYTDNLEAILQDLEASGKKLEITHTARLSEVKQHLEKWVPSMRDELEGHVKIGSFSRHVGDEARELLATPGAEVLPSLAVYTAKPPKPGSPAAFRRKTRAVACGNWTGVTSEDSTYSAGAQGEAVRTALAVASSEDWQAYVTDITHAGLLASSSSKLGVF